MWYTTLVHLDSGIANITSSLQRSLILRQFNKEACGMELPKGSHLQRIIGMGDKVNPHTGKLVSVDQTFPSHHRDVIDAFRYFPIAETFGIDVEGAMEMGLDRWYALVKVAAEVAKDKADKDQNQDDSIQMQVIKLLLAANKGGDA